jgi:isovaleryl-CoA dehydrogenase
MINYPNLDLVYQIENNSLDILREAIRTFVDQEIAPLAQQIDQQNSFPNDLWLKLGNMGLLGVTVTEQYSGSNLGYLEHVIAMEEISRGSASVGLSYAAHSNLCVNQIHNFGTKQQKQLYLPKLIKGQAIGALAMSEANAGSDVLSMQLTATKQEDCFILNGSKMWVTNGPEANIMIVYAKNPLLSNKNITAFLITDDLPGVYKTPKIDKFGMRGSNTCEVIFNNCKVPINNILGEENQGTTVLMNGLNYERLILAAGPIGIMQACIELATSYIHERKQFGKAIGEFQLIQSKIANFYTNLNASRAYLYALAKLADKNQPLANKDPASVFLFTAEHATKIALDTIQILGGNGYCNEYAAGRLLRDAKLYEIGGGTSEIRRLIIAKEIFKESI